MKTKKPKRRFYTANQIRAEIDRYRVKADKLTGQAVIYDLKAGELVRLGDPNSAEEIGFNREMAKKRRKSAARILDKKLPYLAQKLAEWQTDIMPGIITNGDRSVES